MHLIYSIFVGIIIALGTLNHYSLLVFAERNTATATHLRRVWMQDHCHHDICSGVKIGRHDYVILSHTSIPKQISLNFVNSTIAKIPHLIFDTFPDLQVLRLENCSLETFEKPQFEGASNLMTLLLGHNSLRDVPKNIFLGADNLNTLHLNHNHIRTLHNSSFSALKELKELSLADNLLENLPSAVFTPLRQLMKLNLAGNKLKVFVRGIFNKNLNLTSLNLARNAFTVFESDLLKLQPNLMLLDLSGNIMSELTLNFELIKTAIANDCDLRKVTIYGFVHELEVRNNSLREMPHLPHAANVTSLDLSLNPLGNLQGNPLRRFTGLLRLNLSSNNLFDIPEGLFKKQTQLQLLDISSNSLHTLKFIVFDSLKSLKYFYFQRNNWNCDFLQLLINSFVKRRDIFFLEDTLAPELVDDYIDGVACWYESNKGNSKLCENSDAAMELSIVRNEIKSYVEVVDKKFMKVFRLLEELKMRS